MIQDLKQQKGRPLDRAYLIDAFELALPYLRTCLCQIPLAVC